MKKQNREYYLSLAGGVICVFLTIAMCFIKNDSSFFLVIKMTLGFAGFLLLYRTLISRVPAFKSQTTHLLDRKQLHKELWICPLIGEGVLFLLVFLFFGWLYFKIAPTSGPENICFIMSPGVIAVLVFIFRLIKYMKIRKRIAAGEFAFFQDMVVKKSMEDKGSGGDNRYCYYLFFLNGEKAEVFRSMYSSVVCGEECWLLAIPKKRKPDENKILAAWRTSEWYLADDLRRFLK